MERDPRGVRAGRRLVEKCERGRVCVEEVGRDEGGVTSREDCKVDHVEIGWAQAGTGYGR